MTDVSIFGTCESPFEDVREAFAANFRERGDVGAAVCIYVDGKPVVDLWGGYRDGTRSVEWTPDTIATTYSNGKGWIATCMHMLLDRGLIELDAPVASYWPGFERHGKEGVLVRHILTHTAGLPAPSMRVPDEAIYDFDRMIEYVADSELFWQPGTKMGYHAATFGWLNGGVVQKVTGMTPGEFLCHEIAEPLGADLYWGTPPEYDGRTAEFLPPVPSDEPTRTQVSGAQSEMAKKAFNNPPRRFRAANTREWRAAVIPASNGHASARGLARLYAALAGGGTLDGVPLMRPETVDTARYEQVSGIDVISGAEARRSFGYALSMPGPDDSRGPSAFGHGGLGGSLGYADPDHRMSFGYVMNQAGQNVDHRTSSLSAALYRCLGTR